MNYEEEDELERARARRSRKRQNQGGAENGASYGREDTNGRQDYGRPENGASYGREDTNGRQDYGRPENGASYGRENTNGRQEDYSRRDSRQDRDRSAQNQTRRRQQEDRWTPIAEPGSRANRGNSSGKNGGPKRRKKKMATGKKIAIGIAVALLVLILLAVGGAYAYLKINMDKMENLDFSKKEVENVIISQEAKDKMEKGYWTIAIFGVDSRDNSIGKGNQSDVIMIANLNRKTGEIKLVSVFRDTYLNINDKNTYNKINAAYAAGGPEQAVKALNKNLDLNITNYASFNWKAVATGINILGGIDVDISKSEFYYINAFITETVKGTGMGSVQLKKAGLNHLDGVQAVAYGRLRLMDTDYARTERQRIVIQKAFEKAKGASLSTLNSLVGNMFELCSTNIDELDILRMAKDVAKYRLGESMGFPAARSEQKIKINGLRSDCVVPQTLVSNVQSLHEFLFDAESYTPTSAVQTISKKISDVSGLYNAGKEVDHVRTDQGYIPKKNPASATKAVPKTTEEIEEETEASSEGESSTAETSEGETLPTKPGETTAPMTPGGAWETDSFGNRINPTVGPTNPPNPSNGYPTTPSTTGEADRPKSPADMATQPTTEGPGPGSDLSQGIPEATTASPSPGSGTTPVYPGSIDTPAGGMPTPTESSSIIVSPTSAAAPTTASSPGGGMLTPGSMDGPASAATHAANQTIGQEFPGAGM